MQLELLVDAKTLLVRIPPGGEISPHSHRGIVQHYVIEGQYHTKGQVFGPGSYRLMPAQHDVPHDHGIRGGDADDL